MTDTSDADAPTIDPRLQAHLRSGLWNAQAHALGLDGPADETQRLQEAQWLSGYIDEGGAALRHSDVQRAVAYAWGARRHDDDPMAEARSDLDRALEDRCGVTPSGEHADLVVNDAVYAWREERIAHGDRVHGRDADHHLTDSPEHRYDASRPAEFGGVESESMPAHAVDAADVDGQTPVEANQVTYHPSPGATAERRVPPDSDTGHDRSISR